MSQNRSYAMNSSSEKEWITTLDEEFQITFAQELVDSLGWTEGTKLCQTLVDGRIVFEAMPDGAVARVVEH